ncbi:HVA22-like protein i [Arachis hypogaea]|nr:HVA22-like protein i [Arachis hypogaea]
MAISYWQRAASYGQTRIFDILQFVAAQSTPAPRPATQNHKLRNLHLLPLAQLQVNSRRRTDEEAYRAFASESVTPPKSPVKGSSIPPKSALTQRSISHTETTNKVALVKAEPKQNEAAESSYSGANENGNPPPKETLMEERIRVTRDRLRKTRSTNR